MNFQITYTVNQLLFETTFFHDLTEINWFAANYFCNKALSTSVFFNNHMPITGLCEKYSQRQGSGEPLENFLYANKISLLCI